MDEFEKRGIDLPDDIKARITTLVGVMGIDPDAIYALLLPPPDPISLATLGFSLKDFETVQRRLLPKTGSKGLWRDVIPRRTR